jgi:hypothetical protein
VWGLSEDVAVLEDAISDEVGSLRNKLLQAVKRAKKLKKPKFQGLKRGFTKTILRRRSKTEIAAENPRETPCVKEQTSIEAPDIPDIEPTPLSDVMEVWFPGCHSGKHPHVSLFLFAHNMSRYRWRKC